MDGLLALDLWDMVIEVLLSSNYKKSSTQEAPGNKSDFKEAAGNCVRMSNDLWDVVMEVLRSSKSSEAPTHGAA